MGRLTFPCLFKRAGTGFGFGGLSTGKPLFGRVAIVFYTAKKTNFNKELYYYNGVIKLKLGHI